MRLRKNKKKEEQIAEVKEQEAEVPKTILCTENKYIRWVAREDGGRLLVKDVDNDEKNFLTSDDDFQYAIIKKGSELKISDIVEFDGKVFAKCLSGYIEL